MTLEEFHTLALRLGGVAEKPILQSVQFRVRGRTFATLGWPEADRAVMLLTEDGQRQALAASRAFQAEPTRRGAKGVTLARLSDLTPVSLAPVLADAWRRAYREGSNGDEPAVPIDALTPAPEASSR